MSRYISAGCLLALLLFSACNRAEKPKPTFPAKAEESFRLLSYSLNDWMLKDRDGDFQADDPKPLAEQKHILDLLAESEADFLLLRGIGTIQEAKHIAATLSYPHVQSSDASTSAKQHIAAISRWPMQIIKEGAALSYRIKGTKYSLTGRFQHLSIQPDAGQTLHILHVEFKDKTFHEAGQNEMRRNEARLISQYIVGLIKTDPDLELILSGTLHDNPDSATVRKTINALPESLIDARPLDSSGTSWTVFHEKTDHYVRADYLMYHLKKRTLSTYLPNADIIGKHTPYRPLLGDLKP